MGFHSFQTFTKFKPCSLDYATTRTFPTLLSGLSGCSNMATTHCILSHRPLARNNRSEDTFQTHFIQSGRMLDGQDPGLHPMFF